MQWPQCDYQNTIENQNKIENEASRLHLYASKIVKEV